MMIVLLSCVSLFSFVLTFAHIQVGAISCCYSTLVIIIVVVVGVYRQFENFPLHRYTFDYINKCACVSIVMKSFVKKTGEEKVNSLLSCEQMPGSYVLSQRK